MKEVIQKQIDDTREARENELAEQIEANLRQQFEDQLPDAIERELENTRDQREEELAEHLEQELEDQEEKQ